MKKFICHECGKDFMQDAEYDFSPICLTCLDEFEMPDPLIEMGFPKLQGGRKEVEWAITIRAAALKKFGKGKNKKHTLDDFKNQSSAAWWIDQPYIR